MPVPIVIANQFGVKCLTIIMMTTEMHEGHEEGLNRPARCGMLCHRPSPEFTAVVCLLNPSFAVHMDLLAGRSRCPLSDDRGRLSPADCDNQHPLIGANAAGACPHACQVR